MRKLLICLALLLPTASFAAPPTDFQPDPLSVQREGPAYRYPQAGWIVIHIEGEPYERGYQHGKLLAPEIAGYVRCFAALQSPKSPTDGWNLTRTLVNALFLRRYDKEFLEEMRGIADGASAAGARFDGRPIDLVDVVGINSWAEVETLDSGLRAEATGLEGIKFQNAQPRGIPIPKPMHCSAFAATGPATADGKVVFGHITMFGLYPSNFFNVWLDVKPARGNRVVMQTYPGGIQSGLDYYMNSAGILLAETTIAQTRFNAKGKALASRTREALQYGDSIDKVVEILKKDNNGLYTNEWLLADVKTNEIAMFELGTEKTRLWRSSKNEWFGGTEGFYWGCNNTKDLAVRLETLPSLEGRPGNPVFHPSDRDKAWLKLYQAHKGKIGPEFGKLAFTTPPVAAHPSLDAKFTTTDMAKELKSWATFGPPLGRVWEPTVEERKKYPEIRPLVPNPWVVMHTAAPVKTDRNGIVAVDLPGEGKSKTKERTERGVRSDPVWHGTILPKTDGDAWLAAAFADYERVLATIKGERQEEGETKLTSEDRQRLGVLLYQRRSGYLSAARATGDVAVTKVKSDIASDEWYRIASGKGVLILNELRAVMGDEKFEDMMDSFGRASAGKEVTTAQFRAFAEKEGGKELSGFFDYWLEQKGLPSLVLERVTQAKRPEPNGGYRVTGQIRSQGKRGPASVEVTVETTRGEVTKELTIEGEKTTFEITTEGEPTRVVVDKYGLAARAGGGAFATTSYLADLDHALIVYGTTDEEAGQREAATALQEAIRKRWSNITVPMKSDRDVTEDELKANHVLLVGRPDSNKVVERFRAAFPVRFGTRSFAVDTEHYAHMQSAVIAAGDNPQNPRYSAVVIAGLCAEATVRAAPELGARDASGAEVVVLPNGGKAKAIVVPAVKDLVAEVKN